MELGKRILVSEVAEKFVGKDRYFSNFAPFEEANENSIVWVKAIGMIRHTKANVIVCREIDQHLCDYPPDVTYIFSPNPRYTYLKIIEDHAPKVGYTCNYKLGKNPFIHPSVIIYDNVEIGDNIVIGANCVIGSEGFGFEWWNGKQHKFPHIGRVIIGDNVEIQALTNVDRGALGDTVIGTNTKIDTHCHIGHNTKIGSGCTICAMVQTGGSTTIGDLVYISPNVSILTRNIKIGDGAFIGTGALVTKDVKPGERVMGHPAKPF